MSKWLFTASNIKYPAAYLTCFYINAIKMHKGRLSLSLSFLSLLLSLYISVHPALFFWTCYIIVCLSASFQILPVMCSPGLPGCFTIPSPRSIFSLSLSLARSLSDWISSSAGFITPFTEKKLRWREGNLVSKAQRRAWMLSPKLEMPSVGTE